MKNNKYILFKSKWVISVARTHIRLYSFTNLQTPQNTLYKLICYACTPFTMFHDFHTYVFSYYFYFFITQTNYHRLTIHLNSIFSRFIRCFKHVLEKFNIIFHSRSGTWKESTLIVEEIFVAIYHFYLLHFK